MNWSEKIQDWRIELNNKKCPLCNNGEKIPDAVEKKIKREAEEKER